MLSEIIAAIVSRNQLYAKKYHICGQRKVPGPCCGTRVVCHLPYERGNWKFPRMNSRVGGGWMCSGAGRIALFFWLPGPLRFSVMLRGERAACAGPASVVGEISGKRTAGPGEQWRIGLLLVRVPTGRSAGLWAHARRGGQRAMVPQEAGACCYSRAVCLLTGCASQRWWDSAGDVGVAPQPGADRLSRLP
jgi:hypothetical protein